MSGIVYSNLRLAARSTLADVSVRKRAPRMKVLPRNIKDWPLLWRELYEERAGIIEHQALMPREIAEQRAEREIREQAERQ